MGKIARFIERCENSPMGFGLWLSTALFIIFIRDGIESLLTTQNFAVPNGFHLLHFPVFFLSLLICIIIVLHFFTKTEIQKVSKIALIPFSIIILPVIIDLAISFITKTKISYIYISDNFWQVLLRFFDPSYQTPELPTGIRAEITLVILMAFIYIFSKRKKIAVAVLGAVATYILCFLYISVPAVLIELFKFMAFLINTLHLDNFPFEKGFIDESLVSILELILISFTSLIWLWRYDHAKCKAVIKNMRLTRSLHYILLCLIGALLYSLGLPILDLFALIRIAGMFFAVFFAFQFSVVTNDIFDIDCDKLSNPGRPLVAENLKPDEYLNIGFVYLGLSLLFGYWVSGTCLMIILLFIALYFIYSVPPLRLKRFLLISPLIIGLEAVLAFALGRLSFAENLSSGYHDSPIFWLIFIAFTLSSTVKDLKDIDGDRKSGVITLPTLFGKEGSRKIIAFLVFVSYCCAPYFIILRFNKPYGLVLSIVFGLINLFYIQRRKSQERIIFLLYFIYALLLILIIR